MEGETHEAVSTDESGGVTEDGARDGVARSESGSRSGRLRLLAHQARVELEVLDVPVEVLRRVGDLRARVPFLERLVLLETEHLAEPVGGQSVSRSVMLFPPKSEPWHEGRKRTYSLREAQRHLVRAASIPTQSMMRMTSGIPVAGRNSRQDLAGCSRKWTL